jgi:hypothetical protein
MDDQSGNVQDQMQDDVQDQGAHIDNQAPDTQTPSQSAQSDIDFRALYAQSVRERQQREAELANLQQQYQQQLQQRQQQTNLDVSDSDIEKLGTVETISRVIRKQLNETLGDVHEISRDFKRQKQLDQAESAFYQQFPHLSQYRDVLSSTIRGQLQNAHSVDPGTFATQAFATIGYYTAMNAAAPAPSAPVNTPPSRQAPPPSRTNGAPQQTRNAPRLSELERTAMRRAGYDPNKREDVDSFFAIVNNDEGITV